MKWQKNLFYSNACTPQNQSIQRQYFLSSIHARPHGRTTLKQLFGVIYLLSESELKHTMSSDSPVPEARGFRCSFRPPQTSQHAFFFPFCPAVMTNKRCGLRACGQTQWEAEYPGEHLEPVAEGGNWRVGRQVVDTNSFFFLPNCYPQIHTVTTCRNLFLCMSTKKKNLLISWKQMSKLYLCAKPSFIF